MMRLLEDIWEYKNMEIIEFMRESDETYCQGQILCHDIKRCTKPDTLGILNLIGTVLLTIRLNCSLQENSSAKEYYWFKNYLLTLEWKCILASKSLI